MAIFLPNGKQFETAEEMMDYLQSQRTLWDEVRSYCWRIPLRKIEEAKWAVKYAWQRVFRGWDDRESWNIDHYLSKRLGEQLVAMSEFAHGYPSEDYPFDKWTADLKTHGEALLTYSKMVWEHETDWEYDVIYVPAQDALRWVADNLSAIWD